jgi:sec-independent protein translocase protein TatA
MSPILAFWESPIQLAVVGLIALLLFGKRLPEVMRSLGKGITEFKKGMNGLEEEMHRGNNSNSNNYNSNAYLPPQNYHEPARPLPADERPEIMAPKFQPPTAAPTPPATHVS